MELIGVGFAAEDGSAVVIGEGLLDGLSIVLEIENEDVVFVRVGAVQAGERLDCLDAGKRLVDIHGVEERFVVAGLEFVGADEEAVWSC